MIYTISFIINRRLDVIYQRIIIFLKAVLNVQIIILIIRFFIVFISPNYS